MPLKMLDNGQYVVTNAKQAKEALNAMRELQSSIEEIEKENDLPEMRQDAVEMKKAVQRWMEQADKDQLQCDGYHATLVRANYDGRWIGSDEDLVDADSPEGAIPLKRILKKKIGRPAYKEVWARITKRVVDPSALDDVVAEGILSADDVAPAYVEKTKAPYLRIYDES